MSLYKKLEEVGKLEWTDKQGKKHTLASMDLGYIKNCTKLLERNKEKNLTEAAYCASYTGGEMAEMEAEHAMDEAFRKVHKLENNIELLNWYVEQREKISMIVTGP